MSKHRINNKFDDGKRDKDKSSRRANRRADIEYPIDALQSDPELDIDEGEDEDFNDSEEDEFDGESSP